MLAASPDIGIDDRLADHGITLDTFVFDWIEVRTLLIADARRWTRSRRSQVRTASDREPGEVDPTASLQRAQDIRLDLEYEQMRCPCLLRRR